MKMLLKGTVFRNLNYNNTRLYKFNDFINKKAQISGFLLSLDRKTNLKLYQKLKQKTKRTTKNY